MMETYYIQKEENIEIIGYELDIKTCMWLKEDVQYFFDT